MDNFVLRAPSPQQLERAARVERAKQYSHHDPTRKNWLQRYFEKRKLMVKKPEVWYSGCFGLENVEYTSQILTRLDGRQFSEWERTQNGFTPQNNSGGFFQRFEINLNGLECRIERGQKLYSWNRSVLGESYSFSIEIKRKFVGSVCEDYPINYNGEFGNVARLEKKLEIYFEKADVEEMERDRQKKLELLSEIQKY